MGVSWFLSSRRWAHRLASSCATLASVPLSAPVACPPPCSCQRTQPPHPSALPVATSASSQALPAPRQMFPAVAFSLFTTPVLGPRGRAPHKRMRFPRPLRIPARGFCLLMLPLLRRCPLMAASPPFSLQRLFPICL